MTVRPLLFAAALSAPYWVIVVLWPVETLLVTAGAVGVMVVSILFPPPETADPQFDRSAEEALRMVRENRP